MVTPAQIVKRKKALRAKAVELGVAIPRGFNLIPYVGPFTRELIRRVEKKHWPKLAPTGEFDSKLLAYLFPPAKHPVGVRALATAKKEIGVKENPPDSNSGPRVSQYEAACGIDHEPWCACFVTWCLHQNGWGQKGWNQAYVPAWVATAHAGQHGLLVVGAKQVKAGDIACFDFEHNGIPDHMGIVSSRVAAGDQEFSTVEGNTSSDAKGSQSNGGEVAAKTRSVADVACFIRIT